MHAWPPPPPPCMHASMRALAWLPPPPDDACTDAAVPATAENDSPTSSLSKMRSSVIIRCSGMLSATSPTDMLRAEGKMQRHDGHVVSVYAHGLLQAVSCRFPAAHRVPATTTSMGRPAAGMSSVLTVTASTFAPLSCSSTESRLAAHNVALCSAAYVDVPPHPYEAPKLDKMPDTWSSHEHPKGVTSSPGATI